MAYLLERNITQDYLTCSVCLNTFNDPRQLPCGHSYCLHCLQDYIKSNTLMICPHCRAEQTCPDSLTPSTWIQNLPKDALLVAVINAVEKHSTEIRDDQLPTNTENCDDPICKCHAKDCEYFCVDHDEVFCCDCRSKFHSNCEYISLSDIQMKINSTQEDIETKMEKQLRDLTKLEQTGLLSLVTYQNEKANPQRRLKEFEEKFKQFSAMILSNIKEKEENLNSPDVAIKSKLKAIQIKRYHIEQARANPLITQEYQKYPLTKLKNLTEIQKEIDDILTIDDITTFQFQQFDISLEENEPLTTAMSQGTTALTLEIKPKVEYCSVDIQESPQIVSLENSGTFFQKYRKSEHFVHQDMHKHCSLSGVCIVENHIIIIDQYNNCVRKFSIDGTFKEKFTLPQPHQIGKIGENKIAVTCWDKRHLFLLDILPTFCIFHSTSTKKLYLGIHGLENDRLLVTSPDSSVDIISLTGEIVFSINVKRARITFFSLFRNTLSVPVKAQVVGEDVFVCDSMQKLLVCTDLAGTMKWQKKIQGISGFACSQNEIYCTLSRLDKVIVVSFDGHITDSSFLKINHPWSIDVQGSTIAITEDSPSGKFHVLNLDHYTM